MSGPVSRSFKGGSVCPFRTFIFPRRYSTPWRNTNPRSTPGTYRYKIDPRHHPGSAPAAQLEDAEADRATVTGHAGELSSSLLGVAAAGYRISHSCISARVRIPRP